MLDGEIVIFGPRGRQEFDALGQRIHPAATRIARLAEETPARFIAFDLLARADEVLLPRAQEERRAALEDLVAALGEEPTFDLTPIVHDAQAASPWLQGAEGVVAKERGAPYRPGEREGMRKIKRMRTADTVAQAFRFGKEPNTVGSLILGLYGEDGELHVVGHTSSFKAAQKRELLELLEPYRTHEQGSGEPSRWKSDEELVWEGLRPELVCEVEFDHITGNRIRHGAKFVRWRPDKSPEECTIEQLRA